MISEEAVQNSDILKSKERNVFLLFFAQAFNVIGDNFFNIAVMWIVYEQSRSTLLTAIIACVWHLADIVIGPFAGAVADRFNKVKILVLSNFTSGVVSLIVSLYLFLGSSFSMSLAVISVISLNIVSSFASPARAALIPSLVRKEELNAINARFSTVIQLSTIIGVGSGGVLLSIMGVPWIILLNAFSFFIGTVCFVFFKDIHQASIEGSSPSINVQKKTNFLLDMKSGLVYIKGNASLKNILIFLLLLNVISFLGPLYPALVFENLSQSSSVYGFMQAMAVVGGIAGSLLLSKKNIKFNKPELVSVYSLLAVAICILGLAISNTLWLSVLFMVIQFFALAINSIILNTLIMNYTEASYMGRVLGLSRSISVFLIPVATLSAGWLSLYIGVNKLFLIASILMFAISIYTLKIFKKPNLDLD